MSSSLCLIRQDPARGGLVRAVGSCVAAGLLLRLVPETSAGIARMTAADLPGGFTLMYFMFTAMVAIFVLGANAWTRSSRLSLGLPLPTRHVWAVRTGWLVAVAVLSTAALGIVMGFSFDPETGHLTMNSIIALAAARSTTTVLLLICLYQLPQSERDRIPVDPPYVVFVIGATLFTLVVSTVQITSLTGTLLLFAVATALGTYLYLRIPPTFSVGPTVEESRTPVWAMPDESAAAINEQGWKRPAADENHPSIVIHWTLFKGTKRNLLIWLHLFLIAASATVIILEFFDGTNAFLPLFFLMIYFLPVLQGSAEGMVPFDPLPISRRALWAHAAVPAIAAAILGAGIGLAGFMLNPISFSHVTFSGCCVRIPWEYLELSGDGRVPTITAAWGENYTPKAHPLWKGRTAALYDPFEVGKESSPRFVEYQMRRAAEAVYGLPVPPEFSTSGYESPPNIVGGTERGTFTLDITRGRLSADRNRTAAVALSLLTLLTTVLVSLSLLQFSSSFHRRFFKWASIGIIILVVVAVVPQFSGCCV
ncbi:MAG: hypothetical protein P8127_00275 [Acidobacteriota bacterium]